MSMKNGLLSVLSTSATRGRPSDPALSRLHAPAAATLTISSSATGMRRMGIRLLMAIRWRYILTMLPLSRALAALVLLAGEADARAQSALEHAFDVPETSEAVATITAGCARCDWGVSGREAAALKLSIDGEYSQHLLLVRGDAPAEYRVLLGTLPPGK